MKLTKETLKRIIKEEMMQVMHEMDAMQGDSLDGLKNALEADKEGDVTFEFELEDDGAVLRIDTTSQGAGDVYKASIDPKDGVLVLDREGSSEQIEGMEEAAAYLLNL